MAKSRYNDLQDNRDGLNILAGIEQLKFSDTTMDAPSCLTALITASTTAYKPLDELADSVAL